MEIQSKVVVMGLFGIIVDSGYEASHDTLEWPRVAAELWVSRDSVPYGVWII